MILFFQWLKVRRRYKNVANLDELTIVLFFGIGNLLHYSCLENPKDRGAGGGLQSMRSQRVNMTEAT